MKARIELGDPAAGILKISDEEKCDLIAMPTHGHRFLEDLLYGSTITQVRQRASVPVLLVSAAKSERLALSRFSAILRPAQHAEESRKL